jgi:hypothetical protein
MMTDLKNMSIFGKGHLCAIINSYGDGDTPWADSNSLQYFEADYMRECLQRAWDKNDNKERRDIITQIRGELDFEKV